MGPTGNSTASRPAYSTVLVLAPNWLGDAVMSIPFLEVLRDSLGNARITVACRRYVDEVFRRNSSIDDLLTYERRRGLRALVSAIRAGRPRGGWDACFVLPPSFSSGLAALLSGANRRVGFSSDFRSPMLTDSLDGKGFRETHLSRSYLRLIEVVTGRSVGEPPLPRLEPPLDWRSMIGRLGLSERYAVLAAGAVYGSAKVWPADRYAGLAKRLVDGMGVLVVMAGTGAEREQAETILRSAGIGGMNLAGRCSTAELFAVLRGAELVVGNDSGSVHAAAAIGRPTVAVFGSSSPAWTAPRGPRVRIVSAGIDCAPCFERECPEGDTRCLTAVGIDDVYVAAVAVTEEECHEQA